MTRPVGMLSAQRDPAGRAKLFLPDGRVELVDPTDGDEALTARYGLDRIVRGPEFCSARYLDGPLAGQATGYAINRLGARVGFALPPRPGGPTGYYEVVKLAEHGQPADLRLIQ